MSSSSSKKMSAAADEVRQLCNGIEDEKGNKSLLLIIVCYARGSAEYLEDHYKSTFFKLSNKRIIPTTVQNIGKAISRAREQARQNQKLMLLSPATGKYPGEREGQTKKGHLLIDDSSTFCNVNLRQWENRPEKIRNRRFSLLGDVYLRINLENPDMDPNMPSLSKDEKERLVYIMSGLDSSNSNESSFWDKWKGVIATLLGAIAGVMKFKAGIKLTGAGFYCSHWLGTKLFGGYLSTSAYVSASVPAVGVAFGVAAAVYFIPWEKLWSFLGRLVGALWNTLAGIWNWVKEKLSSLSGLAEDLPPPRYSMSFQSA